MEERILDTVNISNIKKDRTILAIDPSGNFNKGKGGTGIARLNQNQKTLTTDTIWAKNFDSKIAYFSAVLEEVRKIYQEDENALVVVENFRLQGGNRANAQSNSELETSELIGAIETECERLGLDNARQQNTVKNRWGTKKIINDFIGMLDENFDYETVNSPHARDAVKHLMSGYFFTWNKIKGT